MVVLLGAEEAWRWSLSEADSQMLTVLSTCCAFLGIDVNIRDNRGLTALDTVRELPSQKSQQIAALIEGSGLSFCWGDQRTHWPNQGICIWCSCFLSFPVDHMTGKRSAKEADKTPPPQPPLISSMDSVSQKSQGKAALLCQQRGSQLAKSLAEWKLLI